MAIVKVVKEKEGVEFSFVSAPSIGSDLRYEEFLALTQSLNYPAESSIRGVLGALVAVAPYTVAIEGNHPLTDFWLLASEMRASAVWALLTKIDTPVTAQHMLLWLNAYQESQNPLSEPDFLASAPVSTNTPVPS